MDIKKPTKKEIKVATKKALEKTNKVVSNPLFVKVVGYGIVGYAAYKIIDKMLSIPEPTPVNDVPIVIAPDPAKTTISIDQAKIYAQTLLEAMDIQPYGTDVPRILKVFNKINADDFKLIFNVFGKKNYNGTGSPPESWVWQQLDNYQERNLVYWLGSELNSWFDSETYNLVENTLKEAGFIL